MPGIKGSSSPCLSISFLQGCAQSYFNSKYFQSQKNIKAALSDFWPHLIPCWCKTFYIMEFLMFSVQHALCYVFDKWGPNGFSFMLRKCCGTVGRLLNTAQTLMDYIMMMFLFGFQFSLFDSKSKITSQLIFQAQLSEVQNVFPLWSLI